MAVCNAHGLTFDPATHTGCVLCRRGERRIQKASPARRALLWLSVGLCGVCLVVIWASAYRVRRLAIAAPPAPAPVPLARDPDAPPPPRVTTTGIQGPLIGRWSWVPSSHGVIKGEIELLPDGTVRVFGKPGTRPVEGRYAVAGEQRIGITLRYPKGNAYREYFYQAAQSELQLALGPDRPRARYLRAPEKGP